MVELSHVTKRFGMKRVLDDFSLTLPAGQTTCVLGRSGCGKTTLLRVASGLLAKDAGTVRRPPGRAAFVFQEDRLLPWFTALENLTRLGVAAPVAREALSAVLLSADADTPVLSLSGGMRRRLSIARAIAMGGRAFYLDEPLRGLDPATAAPVLTALRGALRGHTGLLISHWPTEALALADWLLLADGPPLRIVDSVPMDRFQSEQALSAWLAERSLAAPTQG